MAQWLSYGSSKFWDADSNLARNGFLFLFFFPNWKYESDVLFFFCVRQKSFFFFNFQKYFKNRNIALLLAFPFFLRVGS